MGTWVLLAAAILGTPGVAQGQEQNVTNEEGPYKSGMRPYEIFLLYRWSGTALVLVNTVMYLGASETHPPFLHP